MILFKRNDIFKFTEPPSFGILGQGEMSWVTERAVKLLNEAVTKHNNTAAERSAEVLDKEIEKNFPKLGYNLSELEALKEKLEAQYGKKEEK